MAEQTFEDAVLTSTFFDKKWSSNNLMRTYELEYPDGTLEARIDYSDWRLLSLTKRIRRHWPYRYNGIEKFTSIMASEYGNTTIYRIVMIYNGFFHPYEITEGTIIKMPFAVDLEALITKQTTEKSKKPGGSAII